MPSSVNTSIQTPLLIPSSPEQNQTTGRTAGPLGRAHSFKQGPATSMGKELRRSVSHLSPRPRLAVLEPSPGPSMGAPDTVAIHIAPASHNPADALAQIGKAGSFSGSVEMKHGRLTSRQPVVDALLQHARSELADLKLDGPASLSLTLDPGARQMYEVLQERCAVEAVDVTVNERSPLLAQGKEPIEGNVLIPLLQAVIMNGRQAFGDNARIEVDGRSLHMHDYLATLQPSVASDHAALAQPIDAKIAADPDLRAKLAAASLLQIATKKNFALGGLMGSLAVSAGLGTAWELAAAPRIKAAGLKLLQQAGLPSPTRALLTAVMGTGVDSIPPVVIESMDTLCVLSILKTMKGDKDWSLKALVPNALKAGVISSVLSIPNNSMQYWGTGSKAGDLAIGTVTTEAAIFGAASGVPMEIKENKDHLQAALVQSHGDGLFAPLPEGANPQKHVAGMTQRALDVDPSTSLAQKSMAVAATVGMVPLILSDKALNLVSESVLRIVRSTVFNPIEAIALNALVLSARAKLPGIFTSDHDKHTDLARLVVQRAAAGPGGGESPIQPKELDRIFNPPQEVLGRAGTFLATAINTGMGGVQSLAAKVGLAKGSADLEQRLPYEAIRKHGTAEAV